MLPTSSRTMRAALCALLVVLVAAVVAAPAGAATRHGKHHGNGGGLSITSSSFGNLPGTAPANAGDPVTKYTLSNARGMTVSDPRLRRRHPVAVGARIGGAERPTSRSASRTSTATPTPRTSRATRTSAPNPSAATATASARWAAQTGAPPGFVLNSNTYTLDANNGVASLHGGNVGFDKPHVDRHRDRRPNGRTVGLKLSRQSPAGERLHDARPRARGTPATSWTSR